MRFSISNAYFKFTNDRNSNSKNRKIKIKWNGMGSRDTDYHKQKVENYFNFYLISEQRKTQKNVIRNPLALSSAWQLHVILIRMKSKSLSGKPVLFSSFTLNFLHFMVSTIFFCFVAVHISLQSVIFQNENIKALKVLLQHFLEAWWWPSQIVRKCEWAHTRSRVCVLFHQINC